MKYEQAKQVDTPAEWFLIRLVEAEIAFAKEDLVFKAVPHLKLVRSLYLAEIFLNSHNLWINLWDMNRQIPLISALRDVAPVL